MSMSFFSQHWYRIADIRPRLKSHADIHRHVYRDNVWYVLQNHLTGKFHRFSQHAYALIEKMDGKRTVGAIWEEAVASLQDDAPSQDEVIQLISQLHAAGALASDAPPDIMEMLKRAEQEKRKKWIQRLVSPLAIRIPLIDPDRLLDRIAPIFRPVFGGVGLMLWLSLLIVAVVSVGLHWGALTDNLSGDVLSPGNLLILALLFPLIKALHEFGHAIAVKIWGGEVHEMGVMLLVFMPVPYVDASASSAFREPYKRLIVGAAGMMVEVLIAVIALFYWLSADAGVAKDIAYNVILIAGVSTIVFNANPLLRFDGYYMLVDVLQIPNLFARANRFFTYCLQKYVLMIPGLVSPVTANGEAFWFVVYAILSFLYRAFLSIAIAIFVAKEFFIIGVLLAVWSLSAMFVLPCLKGIRFLFTDRRLQRVKFRAWSAASIVLIALTVALCVVPFPRWTNVQGVVWLPEEAKVRAGTDCQLTKVLVSTGSRVEKGQPLFHCEDPFLLKQFEVAKSRIQQLEVEYYQAFQKNPVESELKLKSVQAAQADLARIQEKLGELAIPSPIDGRFEVHLVQDLPGMYLKKGQEIAYILPDENTTVRAVVEQNDADLVKNQIEQIELRFASNLDAVFSGRLTRHIPGATDRLPSLVLGSNGGGELSVDPRIADGFTTFQKFFAFDVAVQSAHVPRIYEERVYLRLHHPDQPILWQWLRQVELLLLEEFGVSA